MRPVLFGKSLFESVLDRLKEETETEQEDEQATATSAGFAAFGSGFVGAVFETSPARTGRLERGYLDALDGIEAPPPPEPQIPPHLLRLTIEEIAADLALASDDSIQSLQDKRRAFAKKNHPDGFAEPYRDKANIRMTIANLMVDEALRRLQPRR